MGCCHHGGLVYAASGSGHGSDRDSHWFSVPRQNYAGGAWQYETTDDGLKKRKLKLPWLYSSDSTKVSTSGCSPPAMKTAGRCQFPLLQTKMESPPHV